MSTITAITAITAILERDADGTLHLPLPADAPCGKVKVTATLEPVHVGDAAARQANWERAVNALRRPRRVAERMGIPFGKPEIQ